MKESIRYFNGERLIEYSNTQEDVDFISFKEDKIAKVNFKDGTYLKIVSPYIEYKSKWEQDDSDERDRFGW
ncbi:MAG: hypothetical protein ACFWTV_05770 [Enterococcus faecium]|jgi:hypothetical protein|nr:hypothetical protein [Enterococcus faecium]